MMETTTRVDVQSESPSTVATSSRRDERQVASPRMGLEASEGGTVSANPGPLGSSASLRPVERNDQEANRRWLPTVFGSAGILGSLLAVAALWINTAATNRHFDAQFAESKRVAAETQRLSQENLEGSRREAQARAQREQTESSRRDRELALHKDEYFHRLWGEAMEIAIKPKTQSECLAALTNLKVLASRPAPECCRVEWEDTLTELEGFVSAKLRKLTIASAAAAAAKAANCREGMASNPGNLDVKVADDACRNVSMGTKGDKPWFATVTTTNGTPIQIRCICRNGGKRS